MSLMAVHTSAARDKSIDDGASDDIEDESVPVAVNEINELMWLA